MAKDWVQTAMSGCTRITYFGILLLLRATSRCGGIICHAVMSSAAAVRVRPQRRAKLARIVLREAIGLCVLIGFHKSRQ